jgi:hypothetical protein
LINRLLAESGRKPIKRVKNPFKATRPGRKIPA